MALSRTYSSCVILSSDSFLAIFLDKESRSGGDSYFLLSSSVHWKSSANTKTPL